MRLNKLFNKNIVKFKKFYMFFKINIEKLKFNCITFPRIMRKIITE